MVAQHKYIVLVLGAHVDFQFYRVRLGFQPVQRCEHGFGVRAVLEFQLALHIGFFVDYVRPHGVKVSLTVNAAVKLGVHEVLRAKLLGELVAVVNARGSRHVAYRIDNGAVLVPLVLEQQALVVLEHLVDVGVGNGSVGFGELDARQILARERSRGKRGVHVEADFAVGNVLFQIERLVNRLNHSAHSAVYRVGNKRLRVRLFRSLHFQHTAYQLVNVRLLLLVHLID